jgi:NodT family efflux transporter outer membrane factor (OMF) lipoprotein
MTTATSLRTWLLLLVATLAACRVGPDYERPALSSPAAYKEVDGWKQAEPADQLQRGAWWRVFGDPVLDDLEAQCAASNLDVAVAAAQFRQAEALVRQARAGFLPTVGAAASGDRGRASGAASRAVTTYAVSVDASWEPDLWGRISRTVEATAASADASAADLESARLSAQATLAGDYLLLRIADAQQRLYADTLTAYERSLRMAQNRFAQGVVSKGDVVQAQVQLEAARAQSIDLGVARAQFEHAIAVLVGKPPAELTIAPAALPAKVPPIPFGVPSGLLERRPDVAAAERHVAAANARIGVAAAAFYPTLTLSASAGFRSTDLANWITAPARFWSFGPALAQTLFDGGARSAVSDQAKAAFDAEVFGYRETVLAAFAEVEDACAALRILAEETAVQERAVQAARQAVAIAENQYKAGTISFLDVVITQTALLNNERTAVGILGRQQVACVQLIKALGGGWQVSMLADEATH